VDDLAIYTGSIVVGALGLGADLIRAGPIGAPATIGICMVLFGIHGIKSRCKLPRAQVRRTR
jgi:hypothetical protein